jgi:hypothetical protein
MSNKSPLEKLVEIQQSKCLPTKIIPKDRHNKTARVITPIVEESLPVDLESSGFESAGGGLSINNSSLVVSVNLNIDSDVMDKAIEKSAKIAKGVAAAGAAMLGTAFFLGNQPKTVPGRIKVPLMPKVKAPKISQ